MKALLSKERIADVRTNIERVIAEVLPGLPQSQQLVVEPLYMLQ